ncbi:MAG: sigma-54-dependent Fis family transcriptional regulator [Planctomycetes bacterium]|nr:sigma-54-dependent Fis family transcriptional regulator [Planctomycetota bacterium]
MEHETGGEPQLLRYAADLARLYARSKEDRRRRADLERRLELVTSACVGLARALSPEEAAERLARAAVGLLGLDRAAVYLLRRERPALVGRSPAEAPFPPAPGVTRADLEALGGEPDAAAGAPWTQVAGADAAVVVPLVGRRRTIGFLCGAGRLPEATIERWTLALLAGQAGVVLENLALDAVRGERAPAGGAAPARGGAQPLLGRSPVMERLKALVARLAHVDSPVLVRGETGTGKALVARALHDGGPRARGPFVVVNCGAIPEALVESELFGHEAGAFTGALRAHRGRLEQAQGGTLFLDEVGELPLAAQVKLLTVLEERRYTRVGGEEELVADVRVVSATNRDLEQAVAARAFRADLLWRLNVFSLELPPLRERGADVLALARALADEVAARYRLPPPAFGPEAEARLLGYGWPGNVRELRNVLEKAVILSAGGALEPELLPAGDAAPAHLAAGGDDEPDEELAGGSFAEAKERMLERWEVAYLQGLLRRTGGNVARAAREARVDKKHLHRKLRRYGIDAAALRADAGSR